MQPISVKFADVTHAQAAAAELLRAGLSRDQIQLAGSSAEGGVGGLLRGLFAGNRENGTTLVVNARPEEQSLVSDVLARYTEDEPSPEPQQAPQPVQLPPPRTDARPPLRVHTRVVEEPVEEEVNLREEVVRIETRSVDRAATPEDLAVPSEIEIVETCEQCEAHKEQRVVEETVAPSR